ncbi:MAG: ABC transporter ATP-binding protein [Bacilli bacterium]|nr:ABC transporter ATP-binding protein [Bacilli bacterium]
MKETITNLKKVFKVSNEYRKHFILIFLTSIIQIIVGIILPLYTAKQITLLTNNIYEELILASLMVLGISMINELNTLIMGIACNKFRIGTIKNLQIKLGTELLKIREKDIQTNGTGTFIERLTNDTDNMADMFTHGTGYISRTLMNTGIFIAIFIINKYVFCFYFLVAIILTALHLTKSNKMAKLDIQVRKQRDKVSSLVGELVRGEKDLKMLSAKQTFLEKLDNEIIQKNIKSYNRRKLNLSYSLLIKILSDIFIFTLIILLIILIKKNIISSAIAVALFTYKTNIMTNFMDNISLLLEEVKNFNISTSRVFAIIENKEFQQEKFSTNHLDNIQGNFEFKNVSFSYNDNSKVLNNMSFKINSGETVAFVGRSGAGKSTIFNLLGKIYDIDKGQILIDNSDINTLDEDSIRSNITVISQNPYIFNMSIRDNFHLVKENISDKEIKEALKLACLDEFVNSLPHKLNTIIGEGGTNLSGGQKQRLAIARALIQKTKIILFDEATSALDNETQTSIQKAIDNLKGEYTILIIAHRLSTIKNSDRILLVENGKITAEGTHKELLENNNNYKKLYESEQIEK